MQDKRFLDSPVISSYHGIPNACAFRLNGTSARYSILPAGPFIGREIQHRHGIADLSGEITDVTENTIRVFSNRAPRRVYPRFPGPASNCGLISMQNIPSFCISAPAAGRINLTEIKDTSITVISGTRAADSVRRQVARVGALQNRYAARLPRIFRSSCPYPTSTAITCFAPFCKSTSVNPPVAAPMSSAVSRKRPVKHLQRFFQLQPAAADIGIRFCIPDDISSSSSVTFSDGFSTFCSLIYTTPLMISACAFSLLGARPCSTIAASTRSLIQLIGFHRR